MSRFRWGAATDVGRVRTANQDHLVATETLFAVADGMGGHNGGEIASELALQGLDEVTPPQTLDDVIQLVHQANDRIVDRGRTEPTLRGMGTTLTMLAEIDPASATDNPDDGARRALAIVNVGDSRLYLLDQTDLEQITDDHSLVEALVRDGRLAPEAAATHPQRNVLTRALGIDPKVLVDGWLLEPIVGDRFLLCSDGLFNEVDSPLIAEIMTRETDPQAAAERLVEVACDNGGRDNVTAVVVDIVEGTAADAGVERLIEHRQAVPAAPGFLATSTFEREPLTPDTYIDYGIPTDPHPDEIVMGDDGASPRLITWRLGIFILSILTVLAVLGGALVAYARSGFIVGVADGSDEVVILQGQKGGLLWFDPTIEEQIGLTIDEVPETDRDLVAGGVDFDNLDEARGYANRLRQQAQAEAARTPSDPTTTTTTTTTPVTTTSVAPDTPPIPESTVATP